MPLLAIAVALAAVGYVTALRNPEPDSAPGASYEVQGDAGGNLSSVASGPLRLQYTPGPGRTLQLEFSQETTSDGSEISTRVDLEVREERRKRPDGAPGVQFRRSYERAGIEIEEGRRVVGPRISKQIESILREVESVVEIDAVGKPQNREWQSVTNPQVRQSLRMIRHAHTILMPRPRRGQVNVGDEWRYRLDAEHLESPHVTSIDGSILVRETLVDVVERETRRLAILARSLKIDASGSVRLPTGPEQQSFELVGRGSGRAYFSVEEGAVARSHLRVERKLEIGGGGSEQSARTGTLEWRMREKPTPAETGE